MHVTAQVLQSLAKYAKQNHGLELLNVYIFHQSFQLDIYVKVVMQKNFDKLANLFREARKHIYIRDIFRTGHEREWETEEEENSRREWNHSRRLEWNKETEQLIEDCKNAT